MKLLSKLDGKSGNYEIGPEDARRLMDDERAKNRPIRQSVVARYLRRMREGLWKLNGQAIIISEDGKLLDGQHRLAAVAEYGKPVAFTVLQGDFDFKTMDEGKPRDGRDLLAIVTNHQNLIAVQAATRLLIRHERGMAREASFFRKATGKDSDGDWADISNQEILAFVKRNPGLPDLVARVRTIGGSKPLVPHSPAAAGWHLIGQREGEEKSLGFFEPLLTGAGLALTDPRLALRRKLENDSREGHRPPGEMVFALICKAWAQRDKPVRLISFKGGETFPYVR